MQLAALNRARACACLLFALAAGAAARADAPATNEPRRTVFIFQSYARDAAPFNAVAAALHEKLSRRMRHEWPGQIAVMDMDLTRQRDLISPESTLAAFKQRMKDMNIVLIVTVGDPAARLMAKVRHEAFPGIPVVMAACKAKTTPQALQGSNTVIMAQQLTVVPAISNILQVLPETTNIVVVLGDSAPEREYQSHFNHECAVFTNRVQLPLLRSYPFDQIENRCANLPPRSAILYVSLARDGTGFEYDYDFALRRLIAVANAPVFALYESQFGDRVVGGPLLPDISLGTAAADLAMRILKGEKTENISAPVSVVAAPVYDARELERWKIREDRLPPGASLRFRPPSLWQQYRTQIVILAVGVVVQALLIVALLWNRRRLRQSRAGLRDREHQSNLAERAAQFGAWVWEVEPDRVWASMSCRAIFGLDSDRPLSLANFQEKVHPDDRARRQHALQEALAGGTEYDLQFRIIRPDGSVRWIASRGMVEGGTRGHGKAHRLSGVSMDITSRKEAEMEADTLRQELAHVTRVSMVGEFAASLAHELNQPLAAIIANTDAAEIHARMAEPDQAEIQSILDDIRRDGMRAGDTIHRMRAFLQRREIDMQKIEVEPLVREGVRFVEMDAGARRVAMQFHVAPGVPAVYGDRIQLQQVLLNLIVNGMDAMVDVPAEARHLRVHAQQVAADLVEVSVCDHGHGIPPDKITEVLEPFFTTKRSGLGMGLAISRSIIEAHGGRLWLENNAAGGVTARFTIPAATRERPR